MNETGAFGPRGAPHGAGRARDAAAAAYNAGRFAEAAQAAQAAIAQGPRDPVMLHVLGASLVRIGRTGMGIKALEESLRLDGSRPEAWCDLANGLRAQEKIEEAHHALDRALALAPGHPAAIRGKVTLLKGEGREEEAAALLAPLRDSFGRDPSLALAYASVCAGAGKRDEGIVLLEGLLAARGVPPPLLRPTLNELSRLLDGAGRYDEAFSRAKEANDAGGPIPPQDFFDGTIETWTPERFAAMPDSGVMDETPVFVLGMPRSGTSLAEQILAAHPAIGGIGESPAMPRLEERVRAAGFEPDALRAAAGDYLALLRNRCPGKSRVVDKLPGNYTILAPIVKMLPRAKVVHCVRDARDTCVSCFFQNFGTGHGYTRDLALLGRKYVAYERLMRHWTETLGIGVFELRYETLVQDFEGTVRRLLEHVGVEWDDRVLSFHMQKRHMRTASAGQVHRPLFSTSVGRWRRYEQRLGPLLEALGPRD